MSLRPGILDIASVAAAIRTALPDLRAVGTAASFGALSAETVAWPSAYVIPLAESPGANRYQTEYLLSQRVLARFGVVWAVRDIGDRMGTVANGAIRAVRTAGIIAVCQHRPEDAETACEPVSGRLVSGIDRNGQLFWQDDFAVALNRHIPIS
ncbi:hypothetical protein BOO69_09680 [Sulfitobacter alexandrii]|uniref:DUF3168 domain-containing protein n=1 Tax=Sulfitobacter alexandrii TaxID=1917485 RepID=A0A1J0WHQ0_9RHOB|nr:hypothetical protein [Sulfitobacter alexandrii]APE43654.1 hypothetical protein BOO69_09680 [Sulfitobacter alexandrii]